ncbi:translocation and assembly module lipoprotein TamL [Ferruginibacter albus]|uniref:translocation and assembly module lipoprotein TamL n=1 Tax=Ferruginibacter albus TaxID=2875540 RepID=UPI001CC7E564|nr:BamA/TamA family outer membrane protein [Ferruginibacter albus]UAY53338.1 BamA/TamA family outer membrane protein [Ferruginibacter albus]
MNKIILYSLLLALASCSVKKYLPAGEKLYKGATINIIKDKDVAASKGSLKRKLKTVIKPNANAFILGQPYKVWWWYVIGEPKKPKGLKAWLRKKLGEPPIFMSRVNVKQTAENMQAYMENEGYFHTTAQGDTTNKGYFTTANYTADVHPQYKIDSITWVNDSSELLHLLDSAKKRTVLKVGNPYRLRDIQTERTRLDLLLKTKGYYYFNPDYIMAYADSTIGNHKVDIFLNIKRSTPENAKHAYTVNQIMLFPNYTLIQPPPDTNKIGTFNYDGLLIRDTVHKFKPELFKRVITYRAGSVYSSTNQNKTLNRLINLGTFKFVKNRFDAVKDSGDAYRLNAYYYLTPNKKKSLQGSLDGFSKENNYIGSQLSINWKNRNTFGQAEQLSIKGYGSFEISTSDTLKGANNYRVGGEVSFTFPRYVIPFFKIKESNLFPPRTNLLIGYELFIKQAFYTQNVFRFKYELDWKESSNKEHTFAPVAITYLNASHITDSFYKAAQLNPAILLNVNSEAILSTYYTYTVTTINPAKRNQLYFNGGIDLSGNIAGLITGAKYARTKEIFNTPFAQYVKFDAEINYKRELGPKSSWVNHFQIGIGIPYNNSNILPITKQYLIGGSSSMRGFPMHFIGPGSYQPTANDIRFFQLIGGDYKLLANTEYRFPIAGSLYGAVFVDAGNIWTKDTVSFGAAGQLKKDFYKEIAVSTGAGLRFDASILLIRLDIGIPIRKPFLPDGQRWVIDKIALGNSQWRRDNLILNIAIGYPF